jgi:DOMON domain
MNAKNYRSILVFSYWFIVVLSAARPTVAKSGDSERRISEDLFIPASSGGSTIYNDPETYFGGSRNLSYLEWVLQLVNAADDSRYSNSFYMFSPSDPVFGVAVHYRIDEDAQRIHLALAVRAVGWFGIGFAETGGMQGADMLIFESRQPDDILDAHVLTQRVPVLDECQDWVLTSSQIDLEEGFMMIEVNRALDTGDLQDRRIVNDTDLTVAPHNIIAAWGDEVEHSYHGLSNRTRTAIRWHRDEPDPNVEFQRYVTEHAEGSFILGVSNYTIPNVTTTYKEFCFSRDDLIALGVPLDQHDALSIVAISPYIDTRAADHVQ